MEQRHEIFPSHQVSKPEEYPEPEGDGTVLALTTPEGEPVGTLRFDDVGLEWTFASTEDVSAQEHGAELLGFLRGNKAEGTPLADVIAAVRAAYDV